MADSTDVTELNTIVVRGSNDYTPGNYTISSGLALFGSEYGGVGLGGGGYSIQFINGLYLKVYALTNRVYKELFQQKITDLNLPQSNGPYFSDRLVTDWSTIEDQVKLLNAEGKVSEAWALLAAHGDEYASTAQWVTGKEDSTFMSLVARGILIDEAGYAEGTSKFDAAIQAHQLHYIDLIASSEGHLPTTYGIEWSYNEALTSVGLPSTAAPALLMNTFTTSNFLPEWYQISNVMNWVTPPGTFVGVGEDRQVKEHVTPDSSTVSAIENAVQLAAVSMLAAGVAYLDYFADAAWEFGEIVIETAEDVMALSTEAIDYLWNKIIDKLINVDGNIQPADPTDSLSVGMASEMNDIRFDLTHQQQVNYDNAQWGTNYFEPLVGLRYLYSSGSLVDTLSSIVEEDPINEYDDYVRGELDLLGLFAGLERATGLDIMAIDSFWY